MKRTYTIVLAAALVLGSLTVAMATPLPMTRALSDAEMARIVGGAITACQTTAVQHPTAQETGGWICNTNPTFPCSTACPNCDGQTEANCPTAPAQWDCGNNTAKVLECIQAVVDKGQTCTDLGTNVTPCPNLRQAKCAWSTLYNPPKCVSTASVQTSEVCPRTNCKQP